MSWLAELIARVVLTVLDHEMVKGPVDRELARKVNKALNEAENRKFVSS